jgi:hypothetical protein
MTKHDYQIKSDTKRTLIRSFYSFVNHYPEIIKKIKNGEEALIRISINKEDTFFIIQEEIINDKPIFNNKIFSLKYPIYHNSYIVGKDKEDAYLKLKERSQLIVNLEKFIKVEDLNEIQFDNNNHLADGDIDEYIFNLSNSINRLPTLRESYRKFTTVISSYNSSFNRLLDLIRKYTFFDNLDFQEQCLTLFKDFSSSKRTILLNNEDTLQRSMLLQLAETYVVENIKDIILFNLKNFLDQKNKVNLDKFFNFVNELAIINHMIVK